jgi:hypothetical protein
MTFLATHFSLVLGAWRFRVRIDIDEPHEDAIAEPASQRHRSAERAAAILQRSRLLMLVALLMVAAPVIAHAQTARVHRPPLECDATRAHFAIGLHYSRQLAERARRAAHARAVRVIEPGMMYTMEFDRSRLSVYTDRRGMVESVKCE